jgi:hypothetical protein
MRHLPYMSVTLSPETTYCLRPGVTEVRTEYLWCSYIIQVWLSVYDFLLRKFDGLL